VVTEAERKRAKNPFYETMREVAPGDVGFAFANTFTAPNGGHIVGRVRNP
jgi:hypothetical protein